MRYFLAALCAGVFAAAAPALAAAPREIAPVIKAQTPYGQGAYRVLLITAYDAQLWTDAPQWSMQAPFALTLRYHMGFSTGDFVGRADAEMRRVAPSLSADQRQAFDARMTQVFPAVKSGDEITALYQPGKPVAIFHNGQPTGEVTLDGFAEAFFGIWLSPGTSAPSLRAHLLRIK